MVILVDLDDDTSDPAIKLEKNLSQLSTEDDNKTDSPPGFNRLILSLGCYP